MYYLCTGKYTIILGSDDFLCCNPLLSSNELKMLLLEKPRVHYFPVFYDAVGFSSPLLTSFRRLPVFSNIEHQGLLAPTSLLRTYNFSSSYRFAADYHQYLRILRGHHEWFFWTTPFVVFSTSGMSSKTSLLPKLVGHAENIRALYSYSVLASIAYLPLFFIRKFLSLFT